LEETPVTPARRAQAEPPNATNPVRDRDIVEKPDMTRSKQTAFVGALALLWIACSGTSHDGQEAGIWDADSVGIGFTLTGAVGQHLCDFSAAREELTGAQVDGLSSLTLHATGGRAACDSPWYEITIRAQDGSSRSYAAMNPECTTSPILSFQEFDAWAKSTPCSLQP